MSAPRLYYYDEAKALQFIEFDVTSAVSYSDDSRATEYPTEDAGEQLTDQILDTPILITITGKISNTPLTTQSKHRLVEKEIALPAPSFGASLSGNLAAGLDRLSGSSGTVKAKVWQDESKDRVKTFHELITRLKANRTKFDFKSGVKSASGLYLIGYAGPETTETDEAPEITLTLKKLIFPKVAIVETPRPTEVAATPKKQAGSKSTEQDPAAKEQAKKSALASIADNVGSGGFGQALQGLL